MLLRQQTLSSPSEGLCGVWIGEKPLLSDSAPAPDACLTAGTHVASTAAKQRREQIAALLIIWCSSPPTHAESVAGSRQIVLHVL